MYDFFFIFFFIFRRGGSNEYSQYVFLSKNKKNNVYPCKPQFYYIKVGFKGVKIILACFRDAYAICERRMSRWACVPVQSDLDILVDIGGIL